jgi:hypothetical protein
MALTRRNGRQHQLAAVRFVNACERAAGGVCRSSAVNDGDGPGDRWVIFPCGSRIVAVVTQ